MSFEFRVSGFGLKSQKSAGGVPGRHAEEPKRRRILESVRRIFSDRRTQILRGVYPERSRRAQDDKSAGSTPPSIAVPQLETRNPQPETFFDAEFLRKLERLRMIAKRLTCASAEGEHASSRKGFSLEFSDYRRYQRGDDLRYVDWNVYRRLDRLLLKVFTAEEEMKVYLLVDTSRSMAEGTPPKLEYAKKVAAALGYIGLKNLDRVGGASFSAHLHAPLTLGRGRKQVLSLFSFLSKLSCSGETSLRPAIHSFTKLFPQPGLVVVVSDLFDPAGWRAALEELATKKYQLMVIHILDDEEMNPKALGDVALCDVEGGRQRKLFLDDDLVRRYQAELASYFKEIEALCAARHIDYLRATTQVPFDEFVLQTLRQLSSVT